MYKKLCLELHFSVKQASAYNSLNKTPGNRACWRSGYLSSNQV